MIQVPVPVDGLVIIDWQNPAPVPGSGPGSGPGPCKGAAQRRGAAATDGPGPDPGLDEKCLFLIGCLASSC